MVINSYFLIKKKKNLVSFIVKIILQTDLK